MPSSICYSELRRCRRIVRAKEHEIGRNSSFFAQNMGPMGDLVESADDRLDSWKAIAVYLGREVRTVQGWEKSEGLPVHRHKHAKQGSVFAFRSELDAWRAARRES